MTRTTVAPYAAAPAILLSSVVAGTKTKARRPLRAAEYGDPAKDADFLESISPLNFVDRIRAPLMVIHGANDPRVPIEEAEQIVATLRSRGRVVDYLRYEDEGHGLAKAKNRADAWPKVVDFFKRHLAA